MILNLINAHLFPAFFTPEQGMKSLAALQMAQYQRRAVRSCQPFVPPGDNGQRQIVQRKPLLGHSIFRNSWLARVESQFKHTCRDKSLEPGRENVAGNGKSPLKGIKPSNTIKTFANDQKTPGISNRRHGFGNGTGPLPFQQSQFHIAAFGKFFPALAAFFDAAFKSNLPGINSFLTFRTDDPVRKISSARLMQNFFRLLTTVVPALSPGNRRHKAGQEVPSLLRQEISFSDSTLPQRTLNHDASANQPVEHPAQGLAGNTKIMLEFVKADDVPEQGLSQHQKCPGTTKDIKRSLDGAEIRRGNSYNVIHTGNIPINGFQYETYRKILTGPFDMARGRE